MTTGGHVRPRALLMNAVLVPLPAPGAPPRRMISFGNLRFSRPYSASSSCQMDSKINAESLVEIVPPSIPDESKRVTLTGLFDQRISRRGRENTELECPVFL